MPKYRVTGPDGAAYELDAPNDEAVSAAVTQMFGGAAGTPDAPTAAPAAAATPDSAAAPPPARERTWLDAVMDGLGYADATGANFVRGMRRGAANVAGLPVDAVNNAPRLLNMLPGVDGVGRMSERPVGGSDSIDALLGGFGAVPEPPAPQDFVQRAAKRVGEEVGAAAVPGAGALAAGARLGVQGARELPALARMFVEPAAVNPSRFVGKETAVAVGAGGGASVANEAVDRDTSGGQIADLIGAIMGAGAVGVGSAVGRPLVTAGSALMGRPVFVDNVVKDVATDEIARAAGLAPNPKGVIDTDNLATQIEGGQRVADTIPGFQESLADRTRNPGLAAMEYSRQTGPNSGQYTARTAANTKAIDDSMAAVEPQGTPGALRSELEAERDVRLNAAATERQSAETAAADAVEGLTPQSTPQARGATIRSEVDAALERFVAEAQAAQAAATRQADEAAGRLAPQSDPAVRGNVVRAEVTAQREAAQERTRDAYRQAGVNDVQTNPEQLTQTLDNTLAGLTETERALLPEGLIDRVRRLGLREEAVDTGVLDEFGNPITRGADAPDPVRLKEATDLRSELLELRRAANAAPGGRNASRVLGDMADVVDNFVMQNVSPEQQAALREARGARFSEAEAFERKGDPVAAITETYPGGNPRIRDERVAGQFVSPATDAPLQRLFAEADTPAVRTAIRDEIAARLPENARTDPEKLDRFMQAYEIPLRQFPGLRDEIAGAASTRRAAADAETAVGARRQEFSGDSRALADVSARRSDGTPAVLDEQIPGPFANPAGNRDLDALLTRADTPDVRAAIEDELLGRAAPSTSQAERITTFVQAHQEPLKRFPGLRERLEQAATARGAEAQARTAETSLMREIGPQGRSVVAKYLQYGNENAEKAMRAVMAEKDPARAADDLLTFVGDDPKAVEGARKVFWDILQKRTRRGGETTADISGTQPWMPKALKRFVDDPATGAVAERLYRDNPEHWQRIKEIAEAVQGVDVRNAAKAPNTSGTPQALNSGILPTPETLASRMFAVQRGVVSPAFAGLNVIGIMARKATKKAQIDAVQKAIDKALLDPDWAAQLLKENNPANRAALAKRAKGWMGNEASTLVNLAEDDEDETTGAVMRER